MFIKKEKLRTVKILCSTIALIEILSYQANTSPSIEENFEEISQKQNKTREPFIFENNSGKLSVSRLIKTEQKTLLEMNALSYDLVKGGGNSLKISTKLSEKLYKKGWKFKMFLGLEGRDSQHLDVAGFVAYHSKKGSVACIDGSHLYFYFGFHIFKI